MRLRTTFLLLFCVLVVGGFIWFVDRKADTTEKREARARFALRVDAGKVSALSIVAGNLQIDCEKQGRQWLITNPVKTRAGPGEVERILDELEQLPKGEVINESQQKQQHLSPSDYGLDPPRARIVLHSQQRNMVILIGRDAPLGQALYIKEEGEPDIISTDTNILTALPRTVVDLRDRRLFEGAPADVTRIEMKKPGGFLQLTCDAQGRWRIKKPLSARASAGAVQELLAKLYEMRIQDFVADSVAAASLYGLDEPVAQITLSSEKQEQTLLLGKLNENNPDQIYATVQGVEAVYSLPTNALENLDIHADVLRDRRLVTLPAYEITYIEMREGERVVKLLLTNGVWNVIEPKQYVADAQRVQVVLSEWIGAKLDAYSDNPTNVADLGLSPPARTIVLGRAPPATPTTNAAGSVEADDFARILISSTDVGVDRFLVKVDGEDSLYLMASDPVHAISLDPLYYRDHQVLAVDPLAVRTLSVQKGGVEEAVERESTNTFRAANGGKQKVNLAAVNDVLDTVKSLRAIDLIAEDPSDLSLYGLNAPSATLALGLTGEAGLGKSLLIGNDIDGQYAYAMIKGQDVVFTLEKAVADKLTHALYNVASALPELPIENGTNKPAAAGP